MRCIEVMRSKKIYIIVTGDYEFSKKKNVQNDLITPTNGILTFLNLFKAKYSIFLDVCSFSTLEATERSIILKQLKEIISKGHDVQLHFHPNWLPELGGKWDEKGWKGDLTYFRLPNLSLGDFNDRKTIKGLFKYGVDTLTEIVRPVNPNYVVSSFRAGGYCIQPSENIVKVMKELGILADSSVWFGGYRNDGVYYYDFRKAPSRYQPYCTTQDVMTVYKPGMNSGIVEFPIASVKMRSKKWLFFCESFCNIDLCQSENAQIKKLLLDLKKDLLEGHKEHNFLIVTSHPKTLTTVDGFHYFLENTPKLLEDIAKIEFVTMTDAVRIFYKLYPLPAGSLSNKQLNALSIISE